jgi:hypothetical protein
MAKRTRKFVSKKQWAWAFATKKSWARKWAHRNQRSAPYKSLPRRKGRRRG